MPKIKIYSADGTKTVKKFKYDKKGMKEFEKEVDEQIEREGFKKRYQKRVNEFEDAKKRMGRRPYQRGPASRLVVRRNSPEDERRKSKIYKEVYKGNPVGELVRREADAFKDDYRISHGIPVTGDRERFDKLMKSIGNTESLKELMRKEREKEYPKDKRIRRSSRPY